MNRINIKSFLTIPYSITVQTLNYLQDKFSRQPKPETFDNVKINDEFKLERMTFEELVMSRGFPLEIHYVETEDGYILKMYRIPGGKGEINYRKKQKQSILLIHGIFDSSDGWVCNSEENCIPFILANLGYDIWLGNSRGNKHSRIHKKYNSESKEMWNFSFHEMGLYDLPAYIDHITKINTWSQKIIYIAHSQGTTQMFAALTQNLEYFQNKIKLFIALAPVAKNWNMNSKLLTLMRILRLDEICERLAFHELFCNDKEFEKLNSWILPKLPYLCTIAANMICDVNSGKYNNSKMMSVYVSHQPGGSSLKAISHFVQLIRSRKFRMYDYGKKMNKIIYHNEEPTEYDLKTICSIPIGLFSGLDDKLATPKDVEWLENELGDNMVCHKKYEGMGHSTFLMADNMDWFKDVIELIDLYS
jgi:lysosomal acid lipase/cholesteryl ester hydrolase